MKKLMISMLAMAAMVSCTNEIENPEVPVNEGPVPVTLNAGINQVTTKAIVEQSANISAIVYASATTNDYKTLAWTGEKAGKINITNGTTVAFEQTEYYPSNGNSIYMKAVYPTPSAAPTNNIITYDIDGDMDIMMTSELSGSRKTGANASKTLDFHHMLTQLKIKVIAEDEAAKTAWGTISSITVNKVNTSIQLDLSKAYDGTTDAALSSTGSKDKSITFKGLPADKSMAVITNQTTPADIAAAATAMGYAMIQPATGNTEYELSITTSNSTDMKVNVTLAESKASTSYDIVLTFKASSIAATATIGEWVSGTGTSTEVK